MAERGDGEAAATAPSLAARATAALRRVWRAAAAGARAAGYAPALFLLAAIAPVVAGGAAVLALIEARANDAATRRLGGRIAAAARAARIAAAHDPAQAALTRVTVTALVERMARALPAGARLQRLAVDAHGTIEAAIDCPDPDALRAALAADPQLATLRPLSQSASAEAGVRVTLASRLP